MHISQIKVDRQSVCMGDDVMAPNEKMLQVSEEDMLSDVMEKVAMYLPNMHGTVWAVDSGREVIGYIIMDSMGFFQYEFCRDNQVFLEMGIKALHCSYFYARGEAPSLLEEAKSSMSERFIEKLNIDGGRLCIWGEWFGRPYDNVHVVETVQWTRDEIKIHFQGKESLYICNPRGIRNEERQLVIEDASWILWVWYDYGKEHAYENMYVRQYEKKADGSVIRAEGKRSDVRDGDGTPVRPVENIAVFLG